MNVTGMFFNMFVDKREEKSEKWLVKPFFGLLGLAVIIIYDTIFYAAVDCCAGTVLLHFEARCYSIDGMLQN